MKKIFPSEFSFYNTARSIQILLSSVHPAFFLSILCLSKIDIRRYSRTPSILGVELNLLINDCHKILSRAIYSQITTMVDLKRIQKSIVHFFTKIRNNNTNLVFLLQITEVCGQFGRFPGGVNLRVGFVIQSCIR